MQGRFLDRGTEEHILFSHRTHGMTQNWLHVFTRIYTEKFSRKGAKGRGTICTFVLMSKIVAHRQKYTETLIRKLFCESLRRLRETIPLRKALV